MSPAPSRSTAPRPGSRHPGYLEEEVLLSHEQALRAHRVTQKLAVAKRVALTVTQQLATPPQPSLMKSFATPAGKIGPECQTEAVQVNGIGASQAHLHAIVSARQAIPTVCQSQSTALSTAGRGEGGIRTERAICFQPVGPGKQEWTFPAGEPGAVGLKDRKPLRRKPATPHKCDTVGTSSSWEGFLTKVGV